jgi:hypothetical protein
MSITGQDLYNLLPGYYRVKDAQVAQSRNLLNAKETARLHTLQSKPPPLSAADQSEVDALLAKASRGPLLSLMMLIAEQVGAVDEDLNQLYDDAFIETCAKWVIPYIGDLIGYQAVNGVASAVSSPRAEVAHTISFRRRKGTVLVLEQLARDVTGWGAHAVEFFKLLADTQYMNHIRPNNHYAPDLRKWKPLAYMDTGFDKTAHKVDVRRIAVERGKYNIKNIGIFLWSLTAYGLEEATACAAPPVPAKGGGGAASLCFRVSQLGRDMPLFNNPISQGSDITALARPRNVADGLKRQVLCKDIQGGVGAVYYGEEKSLALYINDQLVSPYQVQVCDLSGTDGAWINTPPSGSPYAIALDPLLGRIALPAAAASPTPTVVKASYHYGFNGNIGGGPYAREGNFVVATETGPTVFPFGETQAATTSLLDTLNAAIASLSGGGQAAVEITDNGSYTLAPASAGGAIPLAIPTGATLEFRAADGCRPTVTLSGEIQVSGGAGSSLYLDGLVLAYLQPSVGGTLPASLVHVPGASSNQLGTLNLANCTLVPGLALEEDGAPQSAYAGIPALIADLPGLHLDVQNSILGGIWVNGLVTADLSDSIIDATDPTAVAYMAPPASGGPSPLPGGSLTLNGCTVVGKTYSSLLTLVSDSVFWAALSKADMAGGAGSWNAALWAARKQEGCVRFSYLPVTAILPRQFECVQEGPGEPQPVFVSLTYGDPGYCKLSWCTDDKIRRGADDGGEMGAFHYLLAPLRETDLTVRMQEYLPVGLEFGIYYEN